MSPLSNDWTGHKTYPCWMPLVIIGYIRPFYPDVYFFVLDLVRRWKILISWMLSYNHNKQANTFTFMCLFIEDDLIKSKGIETKRTYILVYNASFKKGHGSLSLSLLYLFLIILPFASIFQSMISPVTKVDIYFIRYFRM